MKGRDATKGVTDLNYARALLSASGRLGRAPEPPLPLSAAVLSLLEDLECCKRSLEGERTRHEQEVGALRRELETLRSLRGGAAERAGDADIREGFALTNNAG